MSPRKNWPKAKPQHPKEEPKPSRHSEPQLKHRPVEDIKRDIANAPAQALPTLQAELVAALDVERKGR